MEQGQYCIRPYHFQRTFRNTGMHLGVQSRNMKIVFNISTLDVGSGNEHLMMKINEYFVLLIIFI